VGLFYFEEVQMLTHHWVARSCGSREKHVQHIHVDGGRGYACFGYTPPKEEEKCR
jgi:hypothetical protein